MFDYVCVIYNVYMFTPFTKAQRSPSWGAEGYESKDWAFCVRFFDSAVREVVVDTSKTRRLGDVYAKWDPNI